jgi:DNA repair protein RadC
MTIDDQKSKPHYIDHRKRIKERFLEIGLQSFRDYEVLELILTYAINQKDLKPVAKELLTRFKSFQGVLEAPVNEIMKAKGIGKHSAILIKLFRECSDYYLKENIKKREVVSSPSDLIKYIKSSMAYLGDEQFRVIFLNSKNEITHEKIVQEGTVDQTAVYPRKVIELALKQKAVALIFVHNHPSGNPTPSDHDRKLTDELIKAAGTFQIKVHDHVIIGKNGYYSFKEEGNI